MKQVLNCGFFSDSQMKPIGKSAKMREWELIVLWLPTDIANEVRKQEEGSMISLLPKHRENYIAFNVQFMAERRHEIDDKESSDKR